MQSYLISTMILSEILDKARKSGVEVKDKPGHQGVFTLRKRGMVDLEAFEVCGNAALKIDASGRYPAQVSAETWTDIIFPV